ncbi:hypothetical protein KR084_006408, partial [Drosophila pseudotakahashii]
MRERKHRKKVNLQEERKERILKFLQENRDSQPFAVPEKKKAASQKKQPQNVEKYTKKDLTSCLIATPTIDQRLAAGENNPVIRRTGNQPRDDEECRFHAPGIFFLRGQNENVSNQEVFLKPTKPIRKELKNKCDFYPKYVEPSPFKDQITQTLYRESSAQTLAYLPESYDIDENRTLELFTLPSILAGDKPPGLYEVEVLERSRKRRKFMEALKENFNNQRLNGRKLAINQYKTLVEAFEWEHWLEREEQIQECQMMRLEIVIKMFDKREREMHAASKTRLERGCELIEKRRRAALRKNEIEYQRGMRRISKQLAKTSIKWEKQTPMYSLGSPCSEFYAPSMRYGVDPARRNFSSTTATRAFNMRIDELEKQINLKIVECPFAKLKQWSQPKARLSEIEYRFCNEEHLKSLYQSLKSLRDSYEDHMPKPECLKVRNIPPFKSGRYGRMTLATIKSFSSLYAKDEIVAPASHRPSEKEAFRQHLQWQKDQMTTEFAKQVSKDEHQKDIKNTIIAYEGSLIGFMMQFLSDEMVRLKELRRLHFFMVLAEKERWRREATEAGLRQKENCARLLYEEMFQQSNVNHLDVSDHYVHSILTNDLGYMAADEAAETVTEMAKQIDVDIERWLESFKLIQNPLTYIPLRLMLHDMVCPDLNATLQRYEKTMIAQYIVEDVIFARMWKELEPYDISSTLTSDLIDRLIDNDLYLFSSESESETSQKSSWYESHAIIRKLIRQSVPGKLWKEETERIVHENYNDLLDNVFDEIIHKMENPLSREPVIVHSEFSNKTLIGTQDIRLKNNFMAQLKENQSDSSAIDTRIIKTQFLNLIKKKRGPAIGKIDPDKDYKGSPPPSIDIEFVLPDDEDCPWPWLPDCPTRSLSEI